MSAQFIRIEGYGRKARGAAHRNARGMIAEIMRAPEASAHIEIGGFEGARVIHGESPNDLLQMALDRSAIATDRRGRALKKNSNILFIAVISFPLSRADRTANDGWAEAYERWSELNVGWASARWQDCDVGVVEHSDEENRHQHIIVVPRLRADGQLDVAKAHPGFGAVAKVIDRTPDPIERKTRAFKARQRTAYCQAMRAFQDDYHRNVAERCGLDRRSETPRNRISRAAALIDQRQASHSRDLDDRERGLIVERFNLQRREAKLMEMAAKIAAERAQLAAEREQLEQEFRQLRSPVVADPAPNLPVDDFDVASLVTEAPRPLKATRPKNDAGDGLWAAARARLGADSARTTAFAGNKLHQTIESPSEIDQIEPDVELRPQ